MQEVTSEGRRQLSRLIKKGLQQREIAKRCRVTEGYVSQVVNGKSGPNLQFANAMAREFGIGQQLWSEKARETET